VISLEPRSAGPSRYHVAGLWIVPWASVSVADKWQAARSEASRSRDFVATLRNSKLGLRPGPHGCSTSGQSAKRTLHVL
jgi:hypothetical protein